ncbi:uncharacterized protein METZ01_LOCUS46270 [marine metagenome]|uniref:Uncharacterized protein n=1 Tax=marine metagenome TaxID=408172 RepID=A0A381RNH4_9ZZZZ
MLAILPFLISLDSLVAMILTQEY